MQDIDTFELTQGCPLYLVILRSSGRECSQVTATSEMQFNESIFEIPRRLA